MVLRLSMPIKKVLVLFVLITILLTGCGGSTASHQPKPIVIGVSLSTSGDFSDDSRYFKQGYELWADTVNHDGGLLGRQVILKILNDASTPEQVTTNYQTLINVDHVDLLFAPFSSLYSKLLTSPLDTGPEQEYTCSIRLLNMPRESLPLPHGLTDSESSHFPGLVPERNRS